ncbi:MAG: helix-turn-helix domain-containing protein [Phycisphaerae bacterium]
MDKLTLIEAAHIVGVSRQAIHAAVRRGTLAAEWGVAEHDVILIDADDLRRWMAARRTNRMPRRGLSKDLKAGDGS